MKQVIAIRDREIEAAFKVECSTDNYIAIPKGSTYEVIDQTKAYYLIKLPQYNNNEIWVHKENFRPIK